MSRQPTGLLSIAAVARWPFLPQAVALGLLRLLVAVLRQRIRREDRRQAAEARRLADEQRLKRPLYCIDGYHGGVAFWDWVILPKGGLWYGYCWDLVAGLLLERTRGDPPLHVVFDVDGHTFEQMARRRPEALAQLREALAAGAAEVVDGTYGQPLGQSVSGESIVRQLYYGLAAMERALGVRVESFLSQEPMFFPQLPQILAGFRLRRAVLRSHWAPFGSEPAEDATLVHWRGPDGSQIPTVPRYRFMDYARSTRPDHRGLEKGGLTPARLEQWGAQEVAEFGRQAQEHGIASPLMSRVADLNVEDAARPHAPLANAFRLAGQGLRFVTVKEYFDQAQGEGPTVSYGLDELPATIPWGLQGDMLPKAWAEAEGVLLVAERLDALTCALGRPSEEEKLNRAWKRLLLAQHHDLHVCGPWLSRRHGRPMAEVGRALAQASTQTASKVAEGALAYLAAAVDTSGVEGQPLLIFNPSPWPRREYVQAAAAIVDLPPLGYRTVAAPSPAEKLPSQGLPCATQVLPDGTLSLEVNGQQVLAGGYLTVWKYGRWHDSRQSLPTTRLIEEEPACRRYLVEGSLAGFPFRQWWTVYDGLPRIDGRLELDFGPGAHFGPQVEDGQPGLPYYVDDGKKLCINFLSPLSRSFCPSPFLLTDSRRESMIGLPFLGLEDGRGGGLTFLNRGTPGYHFDRRQGLLRNVLAWAPRWWVYASDDSLTSGRSRFTALKGGHIYHYAIVPCTSRLQALRAAVDYQLPCLTQAAQGQKGPLPPAASFLRIEPESVLLSALFVQRGKVYARLWNASARRRRARVSSASQPLGLRAVSLDLRDEGPVEAVGLAAWGIRTLRLEGLGALQS